MPRRRITPKRDILPDPKYGNVTLAKFMNHVMVSGKKSVAEKIVYGALDRVKERGAGDPIEVFDAALEAIAPAVEVKSRRVGGATSRFLSKLGLLAVMHSRCGGLWIQRGNVAKNPCLSDSLVN